MEKQFDFEHYKKQAVEDLLSEKKRFDDPDGVLAPLSGSVQKSVSRVFKNLFQLQFHAPTPEGEFIRIGG